MATLSERIGIHVTVVVAVVLLTTAGVPLEAIGYAPSEAELDGSVGRPVDPTATENAVRAEFHAQTTRRALSVLIGAQNQSADAELLAAAREGVGQAIAEANEDGFDVSDQQRRAVMQGADLGAMIVSNESTLSLFDSTGEGAATITPETVRNAARGAAYGALFIAQGSTINDTIISATVTGGLIGSALAASAVRTEGGEVTTQQVRYGAQGAASGAATAVSEITATERLRAGVGHVTFAAAGASAGALAAAGLFPTVGQRANLSSVFHASYGGAEGAVLGTHYHGREPVAIQPVQTLAVAGGAAGGAVSATIQQPNIAPQRLLEGSRDAANETLFRPDLAPNQYLEAAITASLSRLTDAPAGDAVFSQPIQLASYLAVTPRDLDGDGRYEDVNGNRLLSYDDVIMLSMLIEAQSEYGLVLSAEQARAFDFNGDGVFDHRDVHALDYGITGGPYVSNASNESAD